MIIGIGIDMVDSRRVEKLIRKFGDQFSKKYFTDRENEAALSKKTEVSKILFYTKRFAAKEACAKALGTGIRDDVSMRHIEVLNNDFAKPVMTLHAETKEFLNSLIPDGKRPNLHITISDEEPYAIAQVMIEAI